MALALARPSFFRSERLKEFLIFCGRPRKRIRLSGNLHAHYASALDNWAGDVAPFPNLGPLGTRMHCKGLV